ncbi:hypothetical protein BCR44DRAFT_1238395 [Catenaria anguillulae PL171]|uniref:Uncharacterized protein n=1 Tax=Catenaria anguillulae PL171 TaxID=765915 RepID=A0A1Y2HFH5_9FUNG|nr:hypothetical protein BCR44DRAFT_1238395 [Catenaria anguillulae PL171]
MLSSWIFSLGLAPRPLGTPASIPSSTAGPATAAATANAPPPGFGGFQPQPHQPTPVAASAANVAPPPGFSGFPGSPFAPTPSAAAQFNNINASGAFGGHSATATAAGFGIGAGTPSTPFPQPTAASAGGPAAAAATVSSTPGSSVPTAAAARGFARPALGPPPMTPGGEYSPLPIPPPAPSSSSASAAAANAFANSYFTPPLQPHLAAAAASGLQSPSAFASSSSSWPAPAGLSSSSALSAASSFPPPTSAGFNFNMPTPTSSGASSQSNLAKDTTPSTPMVTSTYTPSQPVKPNIPPPQPHNRVLILRSDKKPEPVKETAPVDAATSDKARDPSPSPAPRTKKGRAAAAAAAAKEKEEAAKKQAAQAKRQAPPTAAPAEKAPTPTPAAPASSSDAEPALSPTSPAASDQAQPDAESTDPPAVADAEPEPEVQQEAQTLLLDGTELPISLFGESRATDSLFGQLFEAQPANGTLPPSPISYGLVPNDAPLASTSQLLSALGLTDVMRDVDAWAHQVLADAAATGSGAAAAPAGASSLDMDQLVATLQSFFDRGAQVLFGYAPPPASAVPGHLGGDDGDEGSKNGSGNTSRGDKEVETVTEFLAKLQAEFDGFNNEYVKADVLDAFKEELAEAKKEAAHWEARLTQARKKNRKAGIA